MRKILDAKVHFVTGKGGVGKTLVAEALAHLFSEQHKTLLIELSEDEADAYAERPKLASIGAHASRKFSYLRIFPDQTLYEYLTLKIPQKRVLDSFMSHNLFRAFGAAMPGLADLTRLGKIWFHADSDHEPFGDIFDKIVVDMASSGFVGRFLTIARVVKDAVKFGPLAKEASLINDYFIKPENARLHIVSLPQELVVNETIQLVDEIRKTQTMALGYLMLNRWFPEEAAPEANIERLGPQLKKVVHFFQERVRAEAAERMRLNSQNLPIIALPEMFGEIR